jgi:hypothetical protein
MACPAREPHEPLPKPSHDGVYKIIGQGEKAIRANPAKAVGDLAKKVFGVL